MSHQATFETFYEDIYDALSDVVRAGGGAERVGPMIWPGKGKQAAGWLRDCLNRDRTEKLDLPEMQFLLKLGRQIGCHSAVNYICTTAGYSRPTPINPEDELSELQREYIDAVKTMKHVADRMEALQPSLRAVR